MINDDPDDDQKKISPLAELFKNSAVMHNCRSQTVYHIYKLVS
jgi:hypothetical protein